MERPDGVTQIGRMDDHFAQKLPLRGEGKGTTVHVQGECLGLGDQSEMDGHVGRHDAVRHGFSNLLAHFSLHAWETRTGLGKRWAMV